MSGTAWYRVKVTIHDAAVPLALYIPRISSSYEVFAEGKFIGGCGGLPPKERADTAVSAVFPLRLSLNPGDHVFGCVPSSRHGSQPGTLHE